MDVRTLLQEARKAGLTMQMVGGRLRIRGPCSAEPIVRQLFAHKQAVLAAFGHGDEQAPQPGRDYPAWWDEPLPDAQ
jgi:hypothetical protein